MALPSPSKMITLVSSDGENFAVEEEAAKKSLTISHLIEDVCDDYVIPLPNVTSKILSMVIEYCKKHADAPASELENWDADFVKMDQETLFDLMLAASYLNIKSLLDLTAKTVAGMMKGKTPEEIREIFNIKNDYTPEEEEDIRKENLWAFDSDREESK